MGRVVLDLPEDVHVALLAHLLPPNPRWEEAAFIFARAAPDGDDLVFQFVEWVAVGPAGFVHRSSGYLELTDETRARVIKRAHDLGASIVEFHSHPYPGPPSFSPSDRVGLEEFVPHVWWRLKGRPYVAVVVSPSGFDALAWIGDAKIPQLLDGITVGRNFLRPSSITLRRWQASDEW